MRGGKGNEKKKTVMVIAKLVNVVVMVTIFYDASEPLLMLTFYRRPRFLTFGDILVVMIKRQRHFHANNFMRLATG